MQRANRQIARSTERAIEQRDEQRLRAGLAAEALRVEFTRCASPRRLRFDPMMLSHSGRYHKSLTNPGACATLRHSLPHITPCR